MNVPEKEFRIGQQVLKEHDLEFTVEYRGENFTMKYPTPAQRHIIESEIARRLGGQPRESFSAAWLQTMEACVYIDNMIVPEKCPDWFTNVWEVLDEELIGKLYTGYFQFRSELQRGIREGRYKGAGSGRGA